jgi:uncharacterized protein YjbI with pentapeptide repeats
MASRSREEVLQRIKRGERMDRADLRNIDLSRESLAGVAFDRADLDGANLEGCDLLKASLRRATLREAYLVGADLTGANLENADLEGAKLERAILKNANLTRANLEGAILTNADLTGAQLSYAQLATAKLGGANLAQAVLLHAELDEAYLGSTMGGGAKLGNASLVGANLEDARFPNANFDEADLRDAILRNIDLSGTSLVKTDLSNTDLTGANLSGTDLRHATFARAQIGGARFTGAKAAGLVGTGSPHEAVEVTWLDLSPAGDGTQRIENGVIPSVLMLGASVLSAPAAANDGPRRYFGRGDVLRNATLQFNSGARVEIDSLFQNCTLNLGEATELVIGADGVLADCEIIGAGCVTVHGKFFERQSPGIIGPRMLSVSARGTVVSAVSQNTERTQFAFESGCQLRLKVVGPSKPNEVKR